MSWSPVLSDSVVRVLLCVGGGGDGGRKGGGGVLRG